MASCSGTWRRVLLTGLRGSSFSPGLCGELQVTNIISRDYSTKQESKLWQQKPNRKPRLSIVLTEDVYNLGSKGQIVKVKHGYGRNYLIPEKRAVYATHYNITKMNAYEIKREDASVTSTKVVVDFLHGKTLCVQHDPNDMSAIFEQHISTAFYKTLNLYVPLHCVELKEPITDFDAEHSVGVRLDEDTVVQVPVVVERSLSERKQRILEERSLRKQEKSRDSEQDTDL